MTKASDNPYPSILFDEQAGAPTTPASGFWRAYFKSDGLYVVDDAGNETGPFGTGGGGGSSGPFPLGMPYGTLDHSYTFASTTESWTTDFGTLTQTSGKLQLANASGSTGTVLEPSGAVTAADGEFQVLLAVTSGNVGHVVFRVVDANNHYLLEIRNQGAATPGINLYKRVSGSYTQIGNGVADKAPVLYPAAQILYTVRYVGSTISVYANNAHVGTWVDSTYTAAGRVGVGCPTANTIQADNARVYSITTETQASPGTGVRV